MADGVALSFTPLTTAIDPAFWAALASLKLRMGLNTAPIPISASLSPSSRSLSSPLVLDSSSLDSTSATAVRWRTSGLLVLEDTMEAFVAVDRKALLAEAARRLWESILSGETEQDASLLCSFAMFAFADLKAYSFCSWCAMPAFKSATPFQRTTVSALDSLPLGGGLATACDLWLASPLSAPAWLIHVTPLGIATAHPLASWMSVKAMAGEALLAFGDSSGIAEHPGWMLRNLLTLACVRWGLRRVRVLCARGSTTRIHLGQSSIMEVLLPCRSAFPSELEPPPLATGWEKDANGRAGPRAVDLRGVMDPNARAAQAESLNLLLMRWRLFPQLDTARLSSVRCLLIGAGTLGCAVARTLLGWGVRHITFVDCGVVSYSNPVRQSLFEHADVGHGKASAAASRLKQISPSVIAQGVMLRVPSPGHPVTMSEQSAVTADIDSLESLVSGADVVLLLTDSRESRWLPTVLCAVHGKLAINAALAFDTYLVMRHGLPAAAIPSQRLACYFCSDVMAPRLSSANRALDQQCTVTRPGVAPIAAALAVELMVALLHHPDGGRASASSPSPLGGVPHQLRGSLCDFTQKLFEVPAFESCTACSPAVMAKMRASRPERLAFLMAAFSDAKSLEDISGLSVLKAGAEAAMQAFDTGTDEE